MWLGDRRGAVPDFEMGVAASVASGVGDEVGVLVVGVTDVVGVGFA